MRALSPAMTDALASGATTLCQCWRLTRRDGTVLGFTDHDRDIMLGTTLCRAATGLNTSEAQAQLGLAVGGATVQGALDALSLTEADLTGGLYDDASVEVWTVDWTDVSRAVLLDVAALGEVTRSEFGFSAELRSLAHRFDEEQGRSFQRACSADLGDTRCGVDLTDPAFLAQATVVAITGASAIRVTFARDVSPTFFAGGRLRTISGPAAGASIAIRAQTGDLLVLGSSVALEIGDKVVLTAGCDKSPETCRSTFANIENFRGFPHMPGNDVLLRYANAGGPAMDGGSLFQ